MEVLRTHRRTARMTRNGHERLEDFLSRLRLLWNIARTKRIEAHQEGRQSLSYNDQCKMLTAMRAADPALAGFSVDATRSILGRLDKGFRRFSAGKGKFPRAKGTERPVRSFDAFKFRIRSCGAGHVVLVKGFPPFKVDSVPEGEIRMVRVVRTPVRVEIHFLTREDVEIVPSDAEPIGVDMGVENRATLSNGHTVPPRARRKEKVKRHQRKASRKQEAAKRAAKDAGKSAKDWKRSNSWRKERLSLAKASCRESRRELAILHEITTELVREFGPYIAVEDLAIKNMTRRGGRRKRGLNRSILHQNWGTFLRILAYKCERAGGRLVRVDPRHTSKTCSRCEARRNDLRLSVRVFECTNCGLVLHRDVNAACVIRDRGFPPEPGGNANAAPGGFADGKTAGGYCRGADPLGGGSRRGSRKDCPGPSRHSG